MSHGYQHGCHCGSCTQHHAEKQQERRERRLAEGTPRHVVWGHQKSPSGTGWDSYNATHDTPYSTRAPDYAPEPYDRNGEVMQHSHAGPNAQKPQLAKDQMTLGELNQGVRDGVYSREHLVEVVKGLEVIHDGALVAEPEIEHDDLEMGA